MLPLYKQLFAELHESQVEHCVWKNIHETPEALAGTGDLDLYISPGSYVQFVTILRMNGFIRLISHKATPCVEHYYGFDASSGKFCHLHCYFRIVTGESHIKQYVVPVEDYLSDFPNTKNQSGISEMHPVLQYKLNLFRRSIKLSCLPGAMLFFRERHGYQEERVLLEQALAARPARESETRETGWLARIQTSSSFRGEIIAGLRNRFYFRHWNRFPVSGTFLYRYASILLRIAGKLRRRRKMLPMGVGIVVTGRSTDSVTMLERQTASWLGEHFSVVTMQFSPPATSRPGIAEPEENQTLSRAICRFWYSFNRHRMIKSALRQTIAGSIVIWHEQDPIRQGVGSRPCTKQTQSAVTTFVSNSSNRLLDAKPHIDILLCLSDNSAENDGVEDTSTDSETTFVPEQLEASTQPARHAIQISVRNGKVAQEAAWKHEVWQALAAFQP